MDEAIGILALSCARLHSLALRGTCASDATLAHLSAHKRLERLVLQGAPDVSSHGMHSLVSLGLPALRSLSTDMDIVMSGAFVEALRRCESYEETLASNLDDMISHTKTPVCHEIDGGAPSKHLPLIFLPHEDAFSRHRT